MNLLPVSLKKKDSPVAAIKVLCKGCGEYAPFGVAVEMNWLYDTEAKDLTYYCSTTCVERPVGRVKRTRRN